MMGIGAVDGIAMAKLYIVIEDSLEIVKRHIDKPDEEYRRLLTARQTAALQLEKIIEAATENLGRENSEIFDYQLLMLEDKDFIGKIQEIIVNEHVNSEYALDIVAKQYIELFANIDNDYLKERTVDIADLAKRLNCTLNGRELKTLSEINEDSIIAAVDLTPSQTAGLNKDMIKGIILERGGLSSHSVIIARSMGIPCIIGATGLFKVISHGETVIMNGGTGEILISPTDEQVTAYEKQLMNALKEKEELSGYINHRSMTTDGFEVKVYANITSEKEAAALIENGGEGVGLFRTEFLYMSVSTPPSESMQFEEYSNTARKLGERPLIIRTLDAGGDKKIPYLKIPVEENPFLGYRAIRYCLDNPYIFKTQISAMLRAGAYGNIAIMIPMISTIAEFRKARAIIEEARNELSQKGIKHSDAVKVGMMVETPAAAFMAEQFAKEADFFSIGTNDLTQYIFAADRMNRMVSALNSPFQPALLKAVKHVCECANKAGIEVDICGQAGEVPALVPLWIAMGIDNLSVSIPAILKVRRLICETSRTDAMKIMDHALSLDTAEEVENYLKSKLDCKGVNL